MTFGERFKKIRMLIGISQKEMGAALDIRKANISKYENDITEPGVKKLRLLCTNYNININWLITGEGNMHLAGEKLEKTNIQKKVATLQFDKIKYYNELQLEKKTTENLQADIIDLQSQLFASEKENRKLSTELIKRLNELLSVKHCEEK